MTRPLFACRASGVPGCLLFFDFTSPAPTFTGVPQEPRPLLQMEFALAPLPDDQSPFNLVRYVVSPELDEVAEGFRDVMHEHYRLGPALPPQAKLDRIVDLETEGIWRFLDLRRRELATA